MCSSLQKFSNLRSAPKSVGKWVVARKGSSGRVPKEKPFECHHLPSILLQPCDATRLYQDCRENDTPKDERSSFVRQIAHTFRYVSRWLWHSRVTSRGGLQRVTPHSRTKIYGERTSLGNKPQQTPGSTVLLSTPNPRRPQRKWGSTQASSTGPTVTSRTGTGSGPRTRPR